MATVSHPKGFGRRTGSAGRVGAAAASGEEATLVMNTAVSMHA
jgi:hypothetical protein